MKILKKYVTRKNEKITQNTKYTLNGASDIDFTNAGTSIVTCNGIEYAQGEGFSFVAPIFGCVDDTVYDITFPLASGIDIVHISKSIHTER